MRLINLNVPFFRVKKCKKIQLSNKSNKYDFFAFFHLKMIFFCENEASSEHLNLSRRIFFVSEVFGNFKFYFQHLYVNL